MDTALLETGSNGPGPGPSPGLGPGPNSQRQGRILADAQGPQRLFSRELR